ncbi:condensin-2 complex subunit G2-like [Asterias rubens]|uniref:condensin-2 complex subunit G2-like n=1 Tax=Asterias rubens TaxID=7604 RepID=UPI0014555CB6|nr:condensin-2 complex subunit G2-like [Asterias rubens]
MVAPSSTREMFLQAVECDDRDEFIRFVQRHNAKDDDFTMEELLPSFARKQHDRIWTGLSQMCTSLLLNSPFENDEEVAGNKDATPLTHACLQGVVTVATACLAMEKPVVSDHMLETAIILHGVLLDLPDCASKLQQGIAKLCEKWWTNEHAGREELVANTLMYYLVRSLQPSATVADVKSVDSLRQALLQIKMDDDSSTTIKDLLEQCVTRPNYLKQDKGRRFLSFLFSLNLAFTERLHKAIKSQLPSSPRAQIDFYGEVYFKAWRVATGPTLEKLEVYCIQDLMYHAVHASRVGARSLASTLRQLLSYFTKQKRQQGVDKMLLTLYEPIIWRAVKVANASVRANAAALLVDTFPLQDPESNKEDSDALTQKQFDILQDLLDDPCPVVRVTGIHGICRIASVFWEVIPSPTLEGFMTKLVRDMAFDVSTADVRVAVFKGLTFLLDNHLSHPLMKGLLLVFKDFIHDSSEKVRVAFVDLLIKVKGLRTIKYWHIVPMENLLAQLVQDSTPVARRLVSLLFNSLQPSAKTGEVQIERCIALIQTNPAAARVFYQYAPRHMSVTTAGEFLMLLGQCVLGCVRRAQPTNGRARAEAEDGTGEEKENEASPGDEEDEEETLTIQDTDVMEGMLEIIAVLWTGISDQLAKPENQTTKKKLVSRFSKALPEFLTAFQEGRALSAVLVIAGYVPSSSIPTFSRGCLTTLKNMSPCATSNDYAPLLECLVSWGHGSSVLELISDWLVAILKTSPKGKKKSRKVSFNEPVQPKPTLSLMYLDWLLSHYPTLSALLTESVDKLQDLTSILKNTLVCLEQRLMTPDLLNDLLTDEVMVKSLEMHCRLSIHLATRTSGQDQTLNRDAVNFLSELIAWADREILPMIHRVTDPGEDESDGPAAKRTTSSLSEKTLLDLGKKVLQVILSMSSETIMLGITDREFQSGVVDFCQLLLRTDHGMEFLPMTTRLLYQMGQQDLNRSLMPDIDAMMGDTMPSLLVDVIKTLARRNQEVSEENKKDIDEALSEIKPAVREVLHCYHQKQTVIGTESQEIMASILTAVLDEITRHVQGAGLDRCENVAELPTLSSFLLGLIARTKSMLGSFVLQMEQSTSSGSVKSTEGLLATLHVLHAISKGPKKVEGIKTCLSAVSTRLAELERINQEGSEDAELDTVSDTTLLQEAAVMAQDLTKAIGGVA